MPPHENTAPNPLQLPLFGKLFDEPEADVGHKRRKPWAWLLEHVFAIDVNYARGTYGGEALGGPRDNHRYPQIKAETVEDAIRRNAL